MKPIRSGTRGAAQCRLCLAAMLGAALVVLSGSASALETLRVGKAGREAFSFVPVDIGDRTGIFRKNDVAVDISSFGGSARIHQAMTANAIDIALGAGTDLPFILKGEPAKAVAAMAGEPLLLVVIVRTDGSIGSVADLKGRKIATSTVGSLTTWLATELAKRQGWGADGVTVVPLSVTTARLAALKTKEVDAAVVDLGTALGLEKSGDAKMLFRFGDMVRDFHIHAIFATDKLIQERPAALRAFLKGWFETIAFMRSHKSETVVIAKDVMDTDEAIASRVYDELMPMFSDTGKFDPKALDTLRRSFIELNQMKEDADLTKTYTEEFLPK
jgi:ABC-type nitrate/sulfonate/bicarbonate transport system substrate-binding protein